MPDSNQAGDEYVDGRDDKQITLKRGEDAEVLSQIGVGEESEKASNEHHHHLSTAPHRVLQKLGKPN